MRPYRIFRVVKILAVVAVFVAAGSWAVMSLWNALLPQLFGLKAITLVQALGLLVLSRILFGGWRGRGWGGHGRHWMRQRWEQMTPEEREKLRERFRHRCGRTEHSAREDSSGISA